MNPSYNAGGSSIPGAKPGVIASGPDEQPSVPVVSPLSNKPAPMSLGGARRSSGGSKKWILIGAGVLIVALIVVLVVFAVMPKNGGGSGTNVNSEAVFNRLINYVTNGAESTESVDMEYDVANNYYFLYGWDDEEQKQEVYSRTKKLMDNFVNGYKDGDNEVLNNLVASTKEQFDFIDAMDSTEKIYQLKAANIIIEDGDSKGKQDLLSYYKFSNLEDNVYAKDFLQVYSEWIDALTAKVKLFKDNGCVINSHIDNECMKNKNVEVPEEADSLYANVLSYYNMASGFVGNVYNINDLLHGRMIVKESDE